MAVNRHASKDVHFELDDAANASQVLTGIVEINGLPGPKDHIEATAIGDEGWEHVESLERGEFSITGWYDTTATTGTQVVLSGIRAASDWEGSFIYGPAGAVPTTNEKISGEAVMINLEYNTRLSQVVGVRATFRVAGTIDFGTFAP